MTTANNPENQNIEAAQGSVQINGKTYALNANRMNCIFQWQKDNDADQSGEKDPYYTGFGNALECVLELLSGEYES